MERKRICAECVSWEMGDFWSGGSGKHGVVIECKGWCIAKPNKRKRWNYQPCHKCNLFSKREQNAIIMSGCGMPTEEQMETIINFIEEKLG